MRNNLAACVERRPGMKDRDAFHRPGFIEVADDGSLLVIAGISLRRHDDGNGRVVAPRRLDARQIALGGREEQRQEIRLSRSISTWHSGSPNRTLYSISFGPASVIMSPA